MMADLRFGEGCSCLGLINDQPLRRAAGGRGQNEFSIRMRPAKVLDIGAGQSISAHEPINRLSWPTAFHCQRAYSPSQRQLSSNHGRRVATESMRVVSFNLNTRAFAIGFTCERSQRSR